MEEMTSESELQSAAPELLGSSIQLLHPAIRRPPSMTITPARQLFSQIFLWLKNLMTIVSWTRTYDVSITDYLEDSVENPEEEEGEQDLIFDYEPSKAIERKMIFEAEEERGIDSGRAIRDLSASPGFSISFTFLFTNNISTD
ncbi:hypothetical protein Bca52824_011316 [Brassica carinata]|uniref:Uncharacterized protein n=1 Tax=Brassica carinata TaxID=52824 RepID=A0A8X7WHU5_BRACI|nr:hypothetical protein Bca52824_011316 [Brassica carinata]